MKKVLVMGYFNENLGDDLFFKILFDRYKDIYWRLFNESRTYKKIFSKYKNVSIELTTSQRIMRKLHLWKKTFNLDDYKDFDALVIVGGSIFMQWPGWYDEFKQRERIIQYFNNNNNKVFILGANFGPYEDDDFVNLYRELFGQCYDICFREEVTYSMFKDLNNVRVAPDIVFQLKTSRVKKIESSVGISIINLEDRVELNKYQFTYIKKMKELIEGLIYRNYKVNLFSFCKNEGDEDAIQSILKTVDPNLLNNIEVTKYSGDINGFLHKFQSMESIVSCRFHSLILSQVFNQGVYPIIYSNKTYHILDDVAMNKHFIHIKDIDNLDIDEVIKVSKNNKIQNTDVFINSEKQFSKLDSFLISN